MKEIGAIFVVSISEIRTVQLAAIKRRYNYSWIFFWKYYEALFNTTYLIMVLFFQTFSSKDFIFFRSVISSLLISDVDLLKSGNYFTW